MITFGEITQNTYIMRTFNASPIGELPTCTSYEELTPGLLRAREVFNLTIGATSGGLDRGEGIKVLERHRVRHEGMIG